MSVLHIAAKKGYVDVVSVLINSCPEVCELLDNNSRMALHIAVENRQEVVVNSLLKSLIFQDLINEQDKKGNTALRLAAIQGHFIILKMLTDDSKINKGATNNDKKTFVDIILSNKQLKDIEIDIQIEQAEIDEKKKQKNEAGGLKELDEEMVVSEEEETYKYTLKFENKLRDFSAINLVIAKIIAKTTFAAALTKPGGYNEKGLPVLRGRKQFEQTSSPRWCWKAKPLQLRKISSSF
ncbi:ankyrin repeat-containing protein At2g01680-like [Ziziphus jujuba]|uniref:Ankyrin repeat-containing protein At2g01680-like n=1 Tax=Ziziphus jujuba TaxID=326968 RepID=A0A6P4B814_ZIZJJ|nr:ankyrin repeat-containing protein At2g01680-like [Ziziphus jujuba]